jgi:hypothetical protein
MSATGLLVLLEPPQITAHRPAPLPLSSFFNELGADGSYIGRRTRQPCHAEAAIGVTESYYLSVSAAPGSARLVIRADPLA